MHQWQEDPEDQVRQPSIGELCAGIVAACAIVALHIVTTYHLN